MALGHCLSIEMGYSNSVCFWWMWIDRHCECIYIYIYIYIMTDRVKQIGYRCTWSVSMKVSIQFSRFLLRLGQVIRVFIALAPWKYLCVNMA
jgi:hypothetical protein